MKKLYRKLCGLILAMFTGCVSAAATTAVAGVVVPEVPINGQTAGWIGTAIGGLIWAGMKLRTRISRDGVDVRADSYLREALELSKKNEGAAWAERDKAMVDARAAWSSKNADSLELGQLRAENNYLKQRLEQATLEIDTIRRGVQAVGKRVDNLKGSVEETQTRVGNSGVVPLGNQ